MIWRRLVFNTRRDDDEAEDEEKSNTNDSAEKIFRKEYKSGEEIMKNFNQQLNEIHNEDQEVEDKYLIKLIHPQIQMVSEKDINACILVTSTDVELRIVSINVKGMNDVVSENNGVGKLVESRYGVSLKIHMYLRSKNQKSLSPLLTYRMALNFLKLIGLHGWKRRPVTTARGPRTN